MSPASPFDDPVPRGYRVVLATLRIAVAVQCWGAAASWFTLEDSGGVLGALTNAGGWPEPTARLIMNRIAWGLLACGTFTLVRPCWPVLIGVTAWFGFVAALGPLQDTSRLQPAAHAARYLAPLALLLLDWWPPVVKFSLGRAGVGLFFLRLGAAATFAGHGLQALRQSREGGHFVELITGSMEHVFHWDVSTDHAQLALGVIGGMDIGLAIGLMLVRSRPIACWMGVWGILTAVSRVLALGPEAYPMVLIRFAHGGAPFTLFLYWYLAVKEQPAITVPK
ncbi:MAG: hypothetical protein R3B90_14240 [Planctomycetaceae bacterium]